MLSKNQMNSTFMEIAPQFITFLEGEAAKIGREIDRLKATDEAEENQVPRQINEATLVAEDEPNPATAVADEDERTQAIDDAETAESSVSSPLENGQETTTKKRRPLSGLRRKS